MWHTHLKHNKRSQGFDVVHSFSTALSLTLSSLLNSTNGTAMTSKPSPPPRPFSLTSSVPSPTILWFSPPSSATFTLTRRHTILAHANAKEVWISSAASSLPKYQDQALLKLLRERRTEDAWVAYTHSPNLPSSACLSRLVSQLSLQNSPQGLSRAQSILTRLRHDRQLSRIDASALGLLAAAAARFGQVGYASSLVKSMLRSGYLPHVKAWSAVVSRLAAAPDDGPAEAVKLFSSILRRISRFSDPAIVADSRPDTGAFNAALNACSNLGDANEFLKVFERMADFDVKPDVLTYNIVIKLCARSDRPDLFVFVLERIIQEKIPLCITTLHSLVAGYVGFGDIEIAETMIQAMREGRTDICQILRENSSNPDPESSESSDSDSNHEIDLVFQKLLPNSIDPSSTEPPLLPKPYPPDSRIYTTLMKGYMMEGRVNDTVRMLEAMRHQTDTASQPDHVSYTTVVSALVNAGSMDRARQVLAEMNRLGVPANRVTYNILLKGYCKQLQIEEAKDLLREMTNVAGIEPDVVSYNTLIDGCILVDDSAGALSFFNEMRTRGLVPTKVSYTTLMKAFAFTGQPKLAHRVFDEMVNDPRVKVDIVAWNMLVEGYSRLGLVAEAKSVIQKMKDSGFHPNVSTYGSLAVGINTARKPGEALLLWTEIKERMDPKSGLPPLKPDEGLLDALADICVRAAFFKKALEIVACMEGNGIRADKTKYTRIYIEMHSRMFMSKHASKRRQDRREERRRAAEAFKFWLGLPNCYYGSEWRLGPLIDDEGADGL